MREEIWGKIMWKFSWRKIFSQYSGSRCLLKLFHSWSPRSTRSLIGRHNDSSQSEFFFYRPEHNGCKRGSTIRARYNEILSNSLPIHFWYHERNIWVWTESTRFIHTNNSLLCRSWTPFTRYISTRCKKQTIESSYPLFWEQLNNSRPIRCFYGFPRWITWTKKSQFRNRKLSTF